MSLFNLEFAWPWVLICLPLPILLRLFLPARDTHQDAALQVPFMDDFSNISHQASGSMKSSKILLLLASIAWCCFIVAAARPQWLGERVDIPVSGRDLMMAVDLSVSMAEEDFELNGQVVNRLQAVKAVAGEFIQQREGDRLGLILFGQQAYLQTPLTFDNKTVYTMLQEALIGIAGKATAIGDAIGLAIKRLQGEEASSRILILLTDGANTAGEVTPLQAAELAAKQNLKIYTIGVGADTREVGGLFFKRKVRNTEIDEKTLEQIASITGGQYFRARNSSELNKIYALIDELEPVERESQSFRPISALFMYPLAVSLLLSLLILLQPVSAQVLLSLKGLLSREAFKRG